MRVPTRLACALVVFGLASPAFAATIYPDPTIGVRGIRTGSEPITNGNWLELTSSQCSVDDLGSWLQSLGYLCQNYHIDPIPSDFGGFTALNFQTADASGNIFDYTQYTQSFYTQFALSADGTIAYFFPFGDDGSLQCSELGIGEGEFNYFTLPVACSEEQPFATHFQFFFLPDSPGRYQVRLVEARFLQDEDEVTQDNGVAQTAPPIPEPAAALLFALGTATAARRLRRR